MSLSNMKNCKARLLVNSLIVPRFFASLPTAATMERPLPAKKQWKPNPEEIGHFEYERDVSRDTRFSQPVHKGDTTMRYSLIM